MGLPIGTALRAFERSPPDACNHPIFYREPKAGGDSACL